MSNCQRIQSFFRADPDVVHDAIRVTVWGRWFLLLVVLFLSLYDPGHVLPDAGKSLPLPLPLLLHLALHVLMNLVPLFFNGLTHYRLLTNRPLTWRWMLGLGVMDIALTTSYVASHHGFHDFAFLGYYPGPGRLRHGLLLLLPDPGVDHHQRGCLRPGVPVPGSRH